MIVDCIYALITPLLRGSLYPPCKGSRSRRLPSSDPHGADKYSRGCHPLPGLQTFADLYIAGVFLLMMSSQVCVQQVIEEGSPAFARHGR